MAITTTKGKQRPAGYIYSKDPYRKSIPPYSSEPLLPRKIPKKS
jgi:hypothetical protein